MRQFKLLVAVDDYVVGLIHPSVARDEVAVARHRAFILGHLIGGVLALAVLPLFLAARGTPSLAEVLAFAWLIAPIPIAFDLSRTGRLDRAHLLSALSLAGIVGVVAAFTGGLASFALCWIAIVPLEASLSGSRRIIAAAALIALAVVSALGLAGTAGWLPASSLGAERQDVLAIVGAISAVAYAAGLAARAVSIQRHASQALVSGEARYHLLAEHMTDLVIRHAPNGAVVFASPAARRMLGVPPKELHGQGLFERVHVADRPAFLTAVADATRGRETAVEFRLRAENDAHGAPRFVWVEMRGRPVAPAEGREGCEAVSVARDISERKRHEAEIVAAREDADRANDAKGKFLATMSHELRTPLNAIIGFSEILANDELAALKPERRREYATIVHDSGMHLLEVVNGILDMTRIESGNFSIVPEPFQLEPVLKVCRQLFALKAEAAGIELTVELARDLPEITGDKRALKQIVLNLLSNALKFTRAGGRVAVSARRRGDQLVLIVEDSGIGIAEEDVPRLGAPFYQARGTYDRPFEGSGLGLSVVKGLVDLHGGTLSIESRLGEGTRVTVTLPIDCEAALACRLPQRAGPGGQEQAGPGRPDEAELPVRRRA